MLQLFIPHNAVLPLTTGPNEARCAGSAEFLDSLSDSPVAVGDRTQNFRRPPSCVLLSHGLQSFQRFELHAGASQRSEPEPAGRTLQDGELPSVWFDGSIPSASEKEKRKKLKWIPALV